MDNRTHSTRSSGKGDPDGCKRLAQVIHGFQPVIGDNFFLKRANRQVIESDFFYIELENRLRRIQQKSVWSLEVIKIETWPQKVGLFSKHLLPILLTAPHEILLFECVLNRHLARFLRAHGFSPECELSANYFCRLH